MNTNHEMPIEVSVRRDEAVEPIPPAPELPAGYPEAAVAPRYDERGRKFVPEEPLPGIMNLPCGPADALALSRFWAETAAEADRMGYPAGWAFAETRSADFLRIARQLQPACSEGFVALTAEQVEAFAINYAKGTA